MIVNNPPTCCLVEFVVHRIKIKNSLKRDKNMDLARKQTKLSNMWATVIPLVIGEKGTGRVGNRWKNRDYSKHSPLLRLTRILRRVLETWGGLLIVKAHQLTPYNNNNNSNNNGNNLTIRTNGIGISQQLPKKMTHINSYGTLTYTRIT